MIAKRITALGGVSVARVTGRRKMRQLITIATNAVITCLTVTACTVTGPPSDNKNTVGGAAIGAVVGGVIGASASHGNAGATVAGALAGGLLGGLIGQHMDERDREERNAAMLQTLQTSANNQRRHWKNPKTGNSGSITPLSGYTKAANSQTCRDFEETYTREGQTYNQTSRACRDANGHWKLVGN